MICTSIDDEHLLLVASDRISAYDHVLDTPDPRQGPGPHRDERVLLRRCSMRTNHLAGEPDDERIPEEVLGRALVVKRARHGARRVRRPRLPHRVRACSTTSATGAVCGVALPEGLVEASKLPEPIFTPGHARPTLGDHDENITFDAVVEKLGVEISR